VSAKEFARCVLASKPCRVILAGIEKAPLGRRTLNSISRTHGVFADFNEAWSVAGRRTHAGHDHPDAVALHLELSKELRPSDYAVLYWLCQIRSGDLRIFDFGGNAGNLYYSYSGYLHREGSNITWTVFDLPKVIDEGRRIAAERHASSLRFTSSLNDCDGADVLLVSGAFHYWEQSVRQFLEEFRELPRHIILNRTPVRESGPAFITVQRTDSYAVPCLVRNAAEMIAEFAASDYVVVDQWKAFELALTLPLFPERSVPHYSGFYFRLQK
jgi:putative methyltransferase (TIGR04325 family)